MKNEVIQVDERTAIIKIIYKNKAYDCIVDIEDLEKVSAIKGTWHLTVDAKGYISGVRTKIQKDGVRKQYWLHNLVMTKSNENNVIDHIDHNVLNNSKTNLREVTPQENSTNCSIQKENNASGYRNIYAERGKFRVRILGKSFGTYKTLNEAIQVADRERKKIFPLVSNLNNKITIRK